MEKVSLFLIQFAFFCNVIILGFWNQLNSKSKLLMDYSNFKENFIYFLSCIDSKISQEIKSKIKYINEHNTTRYIKFKFICLPIVYIIEHFQKWKLKGKQSNPDDKESKSLPQLIIDLTCLHCDMHNKILGSLGMFWWIPFLSNIYLFKLITVFTCIRFIEFFEIY